VQRVAKVQKSKNTNLDKWGFFYKCKIQNLKCCKTYVLDELRNIRHFAQDQIYTKTLDLYVCNSVHVGYSQ